MNIGRHKNKLRLIKQHRELQYLKAINGVIDGQVNPLYATLRWQKLKQVKPK